MIGKLTGIIDSISGQQLIIDVNGVGYVVSCSANALRKLDGVGAVVSLLVETQVREDSISLYGFVDADERDWFRLLTTVQGVGARLALAILSVLPPEKLGQAIASQDKASLAQADGVGPKLALRIVTELKEKAAMFALPVGFVTGTKGKTTADNVTNEAVSALVNLGYRRMEAFAAVAKAAQHFDRDIKLEALIRAALAELGKKEGAA